MKSVYLDYAAATPLDSQVFKSMEPYLTDQFYNPSATYLAAQDVRKELEQARAEVASCLGSRSSEIIFTAGATEANNLAIQGVMAMFPKAEVLVSAIEHESVIAPAKKFRHRIIPVDSSGVIDLKKLEKMIELDTVLVSVGLVNNEIGAIQQLSDISRILNKSSNSRTNKGLPIYFHTDAAQAPNYLQLQVSRLGVDLMSLNGGKIYGPKQSGALYVRSSTKIKPLILGGGQESNLRSGTENVAAYIGLSEALKQAQNKRKKETERVRSLRERFIKDLEANLPKARINGPKKNVSPHIISVTFPDADNERLMMELDEGGVQVATGSACSASNQEPSSVLSALGMSIADIHSTLRFSFGRQTNSEDIDKTVELLKKIV